MEVPVPVPLNTVHPEGNRALDVSHTPPHNIAGGDCSPANDLARNVPSHVHIPIPESPSREEAYEAQGLTENPTHCHAHCCHRPSPHHYHQLHANGPDSTNHNPQSLTSRAEPLVDIHQRPGASQRQHSSVHHPEAERTPKDQASGCNGCHGEYHGPPRPTSMSNVEVDMTPGDKPDLTVPPEQPLQKSSSNQTAPPMNITQSPFISDEDQLSPRPSEKYEGKAFSSQARSNLIESSQTNLNPQSKPPKEQESVASLFVPEKPVAPCSQMNNLTMTETENNQVFYPCSMTHLNFKEKQLALSAVKKAASNMSCAKLFQEKDKSNSGIIGRRDFHIIMDRVGVLNGMSSREIDAVFKGFSVNKETELDYKRFTAACRQAIEGDHRLSRIAQK